MRSSGGSAALAAINGPTNVVVSGSPTAVERVLEALGTTGHPLTVSHAFHSPLMRPMAAALRAVLRLLLKAGVSTCCEIPIASTVTGEVAWAGQHLGVEHWVAQVTAPVWYAAALEEALRAVALVAASGRARMPMWRPPGRAKRRGRRHS